MQCVSCGGVLPEGLLVVERQRAVRGRQLLDSGQRGERRLHALPCGNVQQRRGIDVCCCVLGVPRWRVLSGGMQRVQRKRLVSSWQLFYCGQRHECGVQCVSCGGVLSCWLREQQRQRGVSSGKFLCYWKWVECGVQCVSCGGVLPEGLLVVERERAVRGRQFLYSRHRF